ISHPEFRRRLFHAKDKIQLLPQHALLANRRPPAKRDQTVMNDEPKMQLRGTPHIHELFKGRGDSRRSRRSFPIRQETVAEIFVDHAALALDVFLAPPHPSPHYPRELIRREPLADGGKALQI